MITIHGTIAGDVTDVTFEPTKARFRKGDGYVVASPIHAHLVPDGNRWKLDVQLPDNTELVSATTWSYICYEHSRQGTEMWVMASDPGTLDYAAVRPRRYR